MLRHLIPLIGTLIGGVLLMAPARAEPVDYLRDVKSLLARKCYACHGALKQEAGLRLDTVALMRQGGDSGQVIDPSDPADSLLLERITADEFAGRMPPEGEPLAPGEIELVRRWLADGAPAPDEEKPQGDPLAHWAFQPLRSDSIPSSADPHSHLVDAFVRDRLRQVGISPAPPADAVTLVRRLFLDLHGLPPTPEELDVWTTRLGEGQAESTASSEGRLDDIAVGELIDYLLASPRYGERHAQYWLDLVRYADTDGFEVNTPRPHAWPYRDYVIQAFNDDKPYDQFLFEQLAGDTIGEDAATGFLVSAAVLLPGQIGKDDESIRLARQDALDEIIVGTSASFLGLTIGCARCHDHKFDPISQADYFALQAFFAGVEYGDREIRDAQWQARQVEIRKLASEIGELGVRLHAWQPLAWVGRTSFLDDEDPRRVTWLKPRRGHGEEIADIAGRLEVLNRRKSELERPNLVFAGIFRQPDETFVLQRGDPEQPLERIGPRAPSVLGDLQLPLDADERQRRVALARWLASAENPLTARVMVNRIWQSHFGKGFVETASDFGLNGAEPSHAELLDWLAAEFIRRGWSMKEMHRLILTSDTYRQSSRIDPDDRLLDADDRLLGRFPSRRLEAEVIRDSVLRVSGSLNFAMGGPGFDFFKSRGGLDGFPPLEKFGENELRRMIYSHKVRMEPVPIFGAFDCPDAGQAMPTRGRSTTALQALNLFNSPFMNEQAEAFAERVSAEAAADPTLRIERAFRLALGRSPSATEWPQVSQVVQEHGLSTLCRVLLNSNEFLFLP
jgi:hypothetical protein